MSKSHYYEMSNTVLARRTKTIRTAYGKALADVRGLHISVSSGNSKLGVIPSISLMPVIDCGNCAACRKSCYDLRSDLIYKQTIWSRAANSAILHADPERYWRELDAWLTLYYPRAFRYHVGGDIIDNDYLRHMVDIAHKHSDIQFLVFTKMFRVVNAYCNGGNEIPGNLHIVFSGWPGLPMCNPHNFPTAHPIFADGETSAPDGARLCTGNCTACLSSKTMCWTLNRGEAVVFPAH